MKTAFLGERETSKYGSGYSGAYHNNTTSLLPTPPPDDTFPASFRRGSDVAVRPGTNKGFYVDAWMEVWDFAGGASFRAFVADNGRERTLFVFFDSEGAMARDLKKGLMALIELSDGPLDCSHIVTCLDRRIPGHDAVELTKSLQWVGFEMTTLDHWAGDFDVTSRDWLFMGMEV